VSLEDIYYVGQTIAVVALLVSILFVGYQIRQNTKAIRATSHHAVTDSFNAINTLLMSDQNAARIFRLGMEGLDSLNDDERVSYSYMLLGYMRIFETLYYQYNNGTMDKKLFDAEVKTLRWSVSKPGFREWWRENPISLSAEYRAFIGGLITEATAGTGRPPE